MFLFMNMNYEDANTSNMHSLTFLKAVPAD